MFFNTCCKHFLRWLPLILIISCFVLFFYFRWYEYLSLQAIKSHQQMLDDWAKNHFFLTIFLFLGIYTLAIALSIPSGFFFDVVGGYLFGTWVGTLFISVSVTVGAVLLYLAVKISLTEWLQKKAGRRAKQMEKGFQANAFNYIVTLRLIPIFPFWLVTIVSSLLKVELKTFTVATFIGIIPCSLIYASLGGSLHKLFASNETIDSTIIFQPQFLYPLIGLALLVILPILYDYAKRKFS